MPGSCIVAVRLKPNAKQQKITAAEDGSLLAWVNAPPVEGKANAALMELLSETLDVPKTCLSIKRGMTSKNKVVEIFGMAKEEVNSKIKMID
ncbi:MAG TPA: DUF167 domain-containing protein [Chitinivibrionales bacterium]|nr:DUF167 domain-containing protein [Chitinivibrionales bacterium]